MVIKKSRFITNLARVQTPEAAQAYIETIKKKEHKATHNCSAYLIGDHNQFQHANDNGEPAKTAGVPMLEALQQMQLQNVVAVVTRYFGGIKLGSGGLIRAYRQSIVQAVNAVGRVQGLEQQQLLITVAYNQLDQLQYWLQQQDIPITNTQYTEQVTLELYLNEDRLSNFQNSINNLLHAQIPIQTGKVHFREIDYP